MAGKESCCKVEMDFARKLGKRITHSTAAEIGRDDYREVESDNRLDDIFFVIKVTFC